MNYHLISFCCLAFIYLLQSSQLIAPPLFLQLISNLTVFVFCRAFTLTVIHTRGRWKFATIFLGSIFNSYRCKLLSSSVLRLSVHDCFARVVFST